MAIGFAIALLVPTAALAGPVVSVGDCESNRGKIASFENDNGTTGYTYVEACYP